MTFLDIFALLVLLTLMLTALGGAIVLGWLPGRIAAQRNHPQADAIRICGWLGLLTMGALLPLAYVWAYFRPVRSGQTAGPDTATELAELRGRLAAIEARLQGSGPRAAATTSASSPAANRGERA